MDISRTLINPSRGKYLKSAIFWITVYVIVLALFTFLDLPFAKVICHRYKLFSRVFQIIGLIPTCISGIFAAISILRTREIAASKVLSVVVSLFSIFLFVAFFLLSIFNLERNLIPWTIVFLLLLIPADVAFVRYLIKKSVNILELRKVAIIALFTCIMAVIGQTLIKFLFNRPRFITLTDPDAQFTYWFVRFPFAPDSAFPSGHAAQSALTFLILYLKRFIPQLKSRKWDITFWAIAIFINGATVFSRLFLGAHYLTDVWAGTFLTLFTISISNQYVERFYKPYE